MKIKAYRGAGSYKAAFLISIVSAILAVGFDHTAIALAALIISMVAFFYYESRLDSELRQLHLETIDAAYKAFRSLPAHTASWSRESAWLELCNVTTTHLLRWPGEKDQVFRESQAVVLRRIQEW